MGKREGFRRKLEEGKTVVVFIEMVLMKMYSIITKKILKGSNDAKYTAFSRYYGISV